jgi:hypothetical protein
MIISNKKREYISKLWFYSNLKQSKPNLVIKYTEQGATWNNYYFTIGEYSFNDFTGISHIEPLPGMDKLTYNETLNLLTT